MYRIYDKEKKDFLTIACLFDAKYWEYNTAEEAEEHLHRGDENALIDYSKYVIVEIPETGSHWQPSREPVFETGGIGGAYIIEYVRDGLVFCQAERTKLFFNKNILDWYETMIPRQE
jgi:hypothetical protein